MTPREQAASNGEHKYVSTPCVKHGLVPRFTSNGTCIHCAQEATDKHRSAERADLPEPYWMGRCTRSRGEPKEPQQYLSSEDRHWWYAGWNDRDIELAKPRGARQAAAGYTHERNEGSTQ